MRVSVRVPTALRQHCGGQATLTVDLPDGSDVALACSTASLPTTRP